MSSIGFAWLLFLVSFLWLPPSLGFLTITPSRGLARQSTWLSLFEDDPAETSASLGEGSFIRSMDSSKSRKHGFGTSPDQTLPSRRDCLRSSALALASPVCIASTHHSQAIAATAPTETTTLPSIEAAIDLISKICNRKFLTAVVASNYNFLYRGIPPSEADSPTVRKHEVCDLLDPATYGSDEAAAYFTKLDEQMGSMEIVNGRGGPGGSKVGSPVRPGNGHLGVTCPKAAAQWGTAASVWPIGEEGVHFAWFVDGGTFWPRGEGMGTDIVVDGRDCGRIDLDDALAGDAWEILFRADQGFLTVPDTFEKMLRHGLQRSFPI